jgi:hypothetical protein
MSTPRVLFILKRRDSGPIGSWNHSPDGKPLASGLSVSAGQMSEALHELGIQAELVQVIDNNCIDREVTAFRPTHVIIEAFWVVPDKFDILRKLHPNVKWIVRNHSKSDFLSHEGGMVGWAIDYVSKGIMLACNSPEATADFRRLAVTVGADPANVVFLPNYYQVKQPALPVWIIKAWKYLRSFGYFGPKPQTAEAGVINIGCFGAIRPLKNHSHQAMAAIEMADRLGLKLKFWINSNRVEGTGAAPILNSMTQMFKRSKHELVELGWHDHADFTAIVRTMDIVMQVSNSETFNIVAADAVADHVPVLVSDEIPWLDGEYAANPNSVTDIAEKLIRTWRGSGNGLVQADQRLQLSKYVNQSKELWGQFLNQGSSNLKGSS